MKRAPITACLGLVLASGLAMNAAAQTQTSNQAVRRSVKAERISSSSEVLIAPTTLPDGSTSIETGGDRWNARGFSLKTLISQVYDVDERRIDLQNNGNLDARYDLTLQLPNEVDADLMQQMLAEALQKKFNLRITPETRAMQVYVISAPGGPGSGLHPHAGSTEDDAGEITYSGKDCPGISSHGIAVSSATIPEFGRALEDELNSAVVDETKLQGSYDFKIGTYNSQDELIKQLHDELGLVVRPQQRKVTVLKVRPDGELASL